MQTEISGGRRITVAALAARSYVLDDEDLSRSDLTAAARAATQALTLRSGLRALLNELVGCWGSNIIQGRLIVWPSNEYLMGKTGLSERSIRYGIRELSRLQLLTPRDSANGKRFAVRDRSGGLIDAFGIDLTPVYARRQEWIERNDAAKAHRASQKRAFDEITICRRASMEALSALAISFPDYERADLEADLTRLIAATPRRAYSLDVGSLTATWREMRRRVEDAFLEAGNGGKICPHIEPKKELPAESWTAAGEEETKDLSLGLIISACPIVADYGLPLRDLPDLINAARYLRGSLGAHTSVWDEAVTKIGAVHAAALVLFVLQRHSDEVSAGTTKIKNPGGYLRTLVRRAETGAFDTYSELCGLRRKHLS